jgi:integrase
MPTYREHKPTGQAVVTLTVGRDANGRLIRRDYYLGLYDSEESKAAYLRVLREWRETQRPPDSVPGEPDWSIFEVALRFFHHVESYYRHPDGTPTKEVADFRLSIRPLVYLYGATSAAAFDALKYQTVRGLLIEGYDHPEYGKQPPLARSVVNQRMGRIKRMFKWAASQKLVPASVFVELSTVTGLAKGRSKAHEPEPVLPVSPAVVAATLPHCSRTLAAMARVQLLTGARPGEVCVLKGAHLDRSGPVWIFRPREHKTAWRGKHRVIYIGPEAQAVLTPFLRDDPEQYCFSPAESYWEYRRLQHDQRKTKVQPFEKRRRRKKNPKKQPGTQWNTEAYDHAIGRACKRAGQPHWSPNQLRKLRATEIANTYGKEVAQAILGHSSVVTTEIYALPNHPGAQKLMGQIG